MQKEFKTAIEIKTNVLNRINALLVDIFFFTSVTALNTDYLKFHPMVQGYGWLAQ